MTHLASQRKVSVLMDLNLEATELRLGLPGSSTAATGKESEAQGKVNNKRSLPDMNGLESDSKAKDAVLNKESVPPPTK